MTNSNKLLWNHEGKIYSQTLKKEKWESNKFKEEEKYNKKNLININI